MPELKIWSVVSRKYQAFDRSGKLPFSIVFGLCRRSPDDTDPRAIRLNTKGTILDVPYALANNLLQLRERNERTKTDVQVDVGQLDTTKNQEPYLTLPSPVGRTEEWRKSITEYHYHMDPESELALLLEPGKTYSIKNAAGWEIAPDGYSYIEENGDPSPPPKKQNLVSSRVDGRPIFQVVESLPWPPKIQTRMQRYNNTADKETTKSTWLEVSVTNMSNEPVTVQTRSRQRFLNPHGAFVTEEDFPALDPRPRIIDSENPAPNATIQIFDLSTKEIVRETTKPGPCGGAGQQKDIRPTLDVVTTLKPGEPLIRHVNVGFLLSKLPDGEYGLRMEPRGMWWCIGDCKDFEEGDDNRVPHDVFQALIPPLMLECEDVLEVQVKDGTAV